MTEASKDANEWFSCKDEGEYIALCCRFSTAVMEGRFNYSESADCFCNYTGIVSHLYMFSRHIQAEILEILREPAQRNIEDFSHPTDTIKWFQNLRCTENIEIMEQFLQLK